MGLEQDWTTFQDELPRLLPQHRDQFVLWRDAAPIAFFADYDSAYGAGLSAFGPDAEFLVARVAPLEPQSVSIAWQAGVMFGPSR